MTYLYVNNYIAYTPFQLSPLCCQLH